jgi:phospholipid-binding lipoprotein MlaA
MRHIALIIGLVAVTVGCAATGEGRSGAVYDPLEEVNRAVFDFNEEFDQAVFGPLADGYRSVTTKSVRGGVQNFLGNLNQPVVFANTVLQGKGGASLDTVSRFVINTTVGIAGIFDPATKMGVPRHREDFGQTLGTWGVGPGPFLVVPFLGPSNLRDLTGAGIDRALDPLTHAEFDRDTEVRIGLGILGAVSARERLDEQLTLLRGQPEPYTALRRNYTQARAAAIRDGKEEKDPFANLPDFDDFEFGDAD